MPRCATLVTRVQALPAMRKLARLEDCTLRSVARFSPQALH
ncbi:MAG TPA: hypothetical protein VGC19_01775 [Rhodanobacter sp.]